MSGVRPVQNRELLLDNTTRATLRRTVDPLINRALNTQGYTEVQSPSGRIYLNGGNILPSEEYLAIFNRTSFDALSVQTGYAVTPGERVLNRSILNLNAIGGLASARIVSIGERYRIDVSTSPDDSEADSFKDVSPSVVSSVLQDIRADTSLGFGSSDTIPSPPEIIEELAALHKGQSVDRSAHFQMISDDDYGDIQMNIGESFELKQQEVGGHIQTRRLNTKKIFELISVLPLDEGQLGLGVRYTSGRRQSEAKLTAEIQGTDFSDSKKQAMYDRVIHDFQHRDPSKFGAGIVSNLGRIIDPDSNIYRLG